MSKAKYSFKESEAARAIRAAKKAGGTLVEIETPDGKVFRFVPTKPDAANATTDQQNDWEQDDATATIAIRK